MYNVFPNQLGLFLINDSILLDKTVSEDDIVFIEYSVL